MDTLTEYAKAHLALLEIGKRFEAVVARLPKRDTPAVKWRIDTARTEGKHQTKMFSLDVKLFDFYVHKKFS